MEEQQKVEAKACGYQDVDCWVRELRAAGWTAVVQKFRPSRLEPTEQVTTTWRSPQGSLYRGPYCAWSVMKYQTCIRQHSRTCTCGIAAYKSEDR
jgi:hypothetical protein